VSERDLKGFARILSPEGGVRTKAPSQIDNRFHMSRRVSGYPFWDRV